MTIVSVLATIPAGQSLSAGVSLGPNRVLRIRTPAQWQPANMTFRIASADVPDQYWPLYHRLGGEVTLSSVRPSTVIGLPADVTNFLQEAWIKIHSGHAGEDILQPSACTFEFVLLKGATI